jgi:hypothetical protein
MLILKSGTIVTLGEDCRVIEDGAMVIDCDRKCSEEGFHLTKQECVTYFLGHKS